MMASLLSSEVRLEYTISVCGSESGITNDRILVGVTLGVGGRDGSESLDIGDGGTSCRGSALLIQ